MTYRFKPVAELGWGVLIAASLVILQALVTLDPAAITDWQTWAIALGGGAVRAAAGAALDYIRRGMTPDPEPPSLADQILALSHTDRMRLVKEPEAHADMPPLLGPH